ncbi:MAG: FAD-dependent oxidoreductase [Rhodobacter sp.]|uniref:NAD(P)/FAD-dependent oxidoreductase n=1 Tax=Pararhodobacter sp. TaxID=2127056 RepID=UPI002CCBB25F|nr:FAD-binding oxidoreductase [Pararhodobacter sp.]MCC0073006.1 FAD-dependent oxidoreductase [Rhodobacter sp.]HPD93814.1 FAD-binding oxidoreductase [Pararhodobacter sp.]
MRPDPRSPDPRSLGPRSPGAETAAPYPDTFYSRTLADARRRPALTGRVSVECAVIGAGFAGVFTALSLARAGMRVALIEAQAVGWGASGRNGGFVSDGFASGAAAIRRRVGAAQAEALQALSSEGVEILRHEIATLAIAGADPVPGILRLRRYDRSEDLRADATPEAPYLDQAAIRRHLETARYKHGIAERTAFHIHPLNTLRALVAEVERLGGLVFEQSPVTGADLDGPLKVLTTPAGRIEAPRVVLATGGYTGPLVPRLRRAILPIATYVMLSEPAPDLLAQAIRTRMAVGDDRRAGDYYRLVQDGTRLLWGGRITTHAASPAGIGRALRAEMLGVYPQLGPLKTDLVWSGLMAYARHRMPQIGPLQPGVWHVTGFGGHGLNTTAIGGRVTAEAILGTSDRVALFAPFGLDWAGGPVGLAAAQATYWALQVQDWWRERKEA